METQNIKKDDKSFLSEYVELDLEKIREFM